jgi:hypothetical protein
MSVEGDRPFADFRRFYRALFPCPRQLRLVDDAVGRQAEGDDLGRPRRGIGIAPLVGSEESPIDVGHRVRVFRQRHRQLEGLPDKAHIEPRLEARIGRSKSLLGELPPALLAYLVEDRVQFGEGQLGGRGHPGARVIVADIGDEQPKG